jgi:hypothetical protein
MPKKKKNSKNYTILNNLKKIFYHPFYMFDNISNDNKFIIGALLIGIIFIVFVEPKLQREKFINSFSNFQTVAGLDEEPHKDTLKVDKLACSPLCCNVNQWPVPHMDKGDTKYVATNLTCADGDQVGCPCITQEQLDALRKRN